MENLNQHLEKTPREVLEDLEKTGLYVFHGSAFKIDKFEPRQAFQSTRQNDGEYKKIPDGEPAVFASPFINTAIFWAVINKKNCPVKSHSGFSADSRLKSLEFYATKEIMYQIKDETFGYVYVFYKEKFQERNYNEVVSYEEVEPDMYIEVTKKDLPEITIKDF